MPHETVADLTVDEFKTLVREVVVQTITEMIGDPDEGLELREDFRVKLQESLATKDSTTILPAGKVAAKLGLIW
jgi:hypothetical protein